MIPFSFLPGKRLTLSLKTFYAALFPTCFPGPFSLSPWASGLHLGVVPLFDTPQVWFFFLMKAVSPGSPIQLFNDSPIHQFNVSLVHRFAV